MLQEDVSEEVSVIDFMPDELSDMCIPVDTLIISDIHLGSEVSRSKDLLRTLQGFDPTRLILNGDVFDDLNFKRLDKNDWKFLSYIRKLSNPKRKCEVVWVAGNHDGAADILSQLLGVEVYDDYMWQVGDETFLAIHGHQFDRFLNENVVISEIAAHLYLLMQKIDKNHQKMSRWVKRTSKTWLRLSEKIAYDAAQYAGSRGASTVFCGHTHQAMVLEHEGVTYYNSGCWTDKPAHFICINGSKVDVCEMP